MAYTKNLASCKFLFFYLKYEAKHLSQTKLVVVTICFYFFAYKICNMRAQSSLEPNV